MATRAQIIDAHFRGKDYYPHVPYAPIGKTMVDEVKRMGPDGLYLSTACALIEKESGGKNLFGCDWGSRWTTEPPYCQVAVTEARVKALIRNVNNGGGQNGVGLTQLTSISLVKEAERMGGAHLPRFQMRVGFRYLNDLIAQLGWPAGAAAYNAGPGNWRAVINTYGADMARLEREWAARLAKTDDAQREGTVPEEVPTWRKNWEVARAYGRNCAAAPILYWFWDGGMLNRSVAGRPASVDGPAPRISEIRRGFCADLLSWMQRRCGLPIPKNRGAGWNYDGGTQAYWLKYRGVMVPFRLSEMRDGDVAFRRFVDGVDEGHIMVSDEGRALQSFARDNLGNPGSDRSYTVAQSHDGGYYQYRIPREKFWA